MIEKVSNNRVRVMCADSFSRHETTFDNTVCAVSINKDIQYFPTNASNL